MFLRPLQAAMPKQPENPTNNVSSAYRIVAKLFELRDSLSSAGNAWMESCMMTDTTLANRKAVKGYPCDIPECWPRRADSASAVTAVKTMCVRCDDRGIWVDPKSKIMGLGGP